MTRRESIGKRVAGTLLCLVLGGCFPIDDTDLISGDECFEDAECVPSACCGQGTTSVHRDNAPNCSAVLCSGSCPIDKVDCGCGIPVCSQGRCTTAVTSGMGC